LDESVVESVVRGYQARPCRFVNSMHADRIAGRPMEIEARNGNHCAPRTQDGIPTPLNSLIVSLLEAGKGSAYWTSRRRACAAGWRCLARPRTTPCERRALEPFGSHEDCDSDHRQK